MGLQSFLSVQKFPVRTIQSNVQNGGGGDYAESFSDSLDKGSKVKVQKILQMLNESESRPAAYYLYNSKVKTTKKAPVEGR